MAVQKILFPYLLSGAGRKGDVADTVVFFGTDFYNLPQGSNQELFIERTNGMLAYIQKNFPGSRLLYQPHPNEKDEYTLLSLGDFQVGKRTIADLLLWEEAPRIAAVFASCSWAAATAYAMGFRSGVFLDLLKDAIPDDALTGYRSYFEGFPDSFFIRSFEQQIPLCPPVREAEERAALTRIEDSLGDANMVWFVAADPAPATRAAMLAERLRKEKKVKVGLIKISHQRWSVIGEAAFLTCFDRIIPVPHVWFTARPGRIGRMLRAAFMIRQLPIERGDAVISFAHVLFAENCILSWFKGIKKILMVESRWYHFTYEEDGSTLPKSGFRRPVGVKFFNAVVEPLLRLKGTRFEEYADGRVLNIARYQAPLERVYDDVFVLVPPT